MFACKTYYAWKTWSTMVVVPPVTGKENPVHTTSTTLISYPVIPRDVFATDCVAADVFLLLCGDGLVVHA